jgi:hypothetical protein
MKLKTVKPYGDDEVHRTTAVILAFESASVLLVRWLRSNVVTSSDELREVASCLKKIRHVIRDVRTRSARAKLINENSELYQLSDSELGAKLSGLELDIGYVVATITTALQKLLHTQHLNHSDWEVLNRYWMSFPVQYHRLIQRWDTATR